MARRPVYWLSLMFTGGIVFSHFFSMGDPFRYLLILLFPGIWMLIRRQNFSECILLFLFLMLGASYYDLLEKLNDTTLIDEGKTVEMTGTIRSEPKVDGNLLTFKLHLAQFDQQEAEEIVICQVYLQSKQDQEMANDLNRGSFVRIKGKLTAPEPARNPNAFDYKQYLYHQRIHWIIQTSSAPQVIKDPPPFQFDTLLSSIQNYLSHSVERTFPEKITPLVKGILLGNRDDIDPSLINAYSIFGLLHILAISGLHMTILSGGALAFLRIIGLTRESSLLLTCAFIPLYVLLTGASPSIVRSGIMAVIFLLGNFLRKPVDGLNIWGASLLSMLFYNPYQLWDIGFQLSFLVTWGLIVFVPIFYPHPPNVKVPFRLMICVTMIAQLVSLPVLIYYFSQFSFWSPLANFFLVPFFSLMIIPVGFASFLIGLIHPGFAYLMAKVLAELWNLINQVVVNLSRFTWTNYYVEKPSFLWLVVYYFVLLSRLWIMKKWIKFWWTSITLLIAFQCIAIPINRQNLVVTILDVGQGDAIVVELPNRKVYLIDGGGAAIAPRQSWQKKKKPFDAGQNVIVPFLKSKGINRIEKIIVTHGDLDHIGGLLSIIQAVGVGSVLVNGLPPGSQEERDLFKSIESKKIPVHKVYKGLKWHDNKSVVWTILNPDPRHPMSSDNNNSVVILLEAWGFRLLFTGDLEAEGENILLPYIIERVDVLKVAHHGSQTSTTDQWVKQVHPSVSVISVGRKNRFGHPHHEPLERLAAIGSHIERTDDNGAITIEIKKGELVVSSQLQPKKYVIRQ
ncbi:DNA internalization-related competence protein ComEC/Rec2 [Ammoniphilus resinae]|uniref:Competence protein ComEC n=1 Tax=Ammoniphilus resinae TaxID=861532 RepID=A0ABS4GJR2_9BACL|nr:DNA internalization-related competence protein ComEC/Rec2 [Ammoniphilus resinae]MBP1930498.1 competence protein ComEC [Ammoniphilus resinae]